jgi:HEAT repeat protein
VSKQLAIGSLCALGLVGVGVWIGKSSSTPVTPPTAQAAPAGDEAAATPSPVPTRSARVRPLQPAPSLDRPADPGLAKDLVDGDPKIRRAAVHELARSDSPDPALLVAASKDADVEVSVTATYALGPLYAQGRVPLAELVARSSDRNASERTRQTALNAFGRVANADAAKILVELLARGEVIERRSAAALLGNQDLTVAVPALIAALGDADEYVRSNALETLRARSRGRDFGTDAAAWQAWWQRSQQR